jgi:RNA polymerase sigma-70 factor (ECF subfamily)
MVRDDELLARAAGGDASSFTQLFRRRQADVFRFAVHMTGSAAIAEDVVQDVFVAVMRDAARYQAGRASVAAWLCGIARNCVLQRLERDRRLVPIEFGDGREPAAEAGGPADPLTGLLRAERIDRLRRAVQALPLAYREVVVLCDLQEMSYGDAAGVIGCPAGTVRSRLHRARAMLAARLSASRTSSSPVTEGVAVAPAADPG